MVNPKLTARLERSSFCATKWSKKAGVEGGNSCPKIDRKTNLANKLQIEFQIKKY